MDNNKIRIFTPYLFFLSTWLLVPAILAADKFIHFYVIALLITMFIFFYWLNNKRVCEICSNGIINSKSEEIILKAFIFSMISAFLITKGGILLSYLSGISLLLERDNMRYAAIDFPYYSLIFRNCATLLGALSLYELWNKRYFHFIICAVPYCLFFLTSVEKAPIATFIILITYVLLSSRQLGIFSITFISIVSILVLYFIFRTSYRDTNVFGIEILPSLLNAIWERVKLSGELVLYAYEFFLNKANLAGASFPILLGLLDLNILSLNRIRIGDLIMYKYRGQYEGTANTSFIVDGYANFGLGGGYLFLILVILYLFCLLKYVILLIQSPYFRDIYKLFIMITIIDLISVDFWVPLESSIFAFCLLFGIERFINLSPKSLNSNI
tara:strand:+ start:6216 stop:7370 length:1155 start_codon:yes stop_codon:yes gene_type:complete